jgi:hypothetical protein
VKLLATAQSPQAEKKLKWCMEELDDNKTQRLENEENLKVKKAE